MEKLLLHLLNISLVAAMIFGPVSYHSIRRVANQKNIPIEYLRLRDLQGTPKTLCLAFFITIFGMMPLLILGFGLASRF